MSDKSLLHIYNKVAANASKVYVVPLIRHNYPSTDYLFLLYKELLNSPSITIKSLSAIAHFKLIFAAIFSKNPILHYHWLEFQDWKSSISIIYKLSCISLFTLFGGKLVWTVHNLYPHNKKWLSLHNKLYRWMSSIATKILVHSSTALKIVANEYQVPESKIEVFQHPVFPSQKIDREIAIHFINQSFEIDLKLEYPIIGSFGAISAYKRLPEAIELVSKVNCSKQMLIAGYTKKGMQFIHNTITQQYSKKDWLFYHSGFVNEQALPYLMNGIDICIFNFDNILTSGGIEMALAYNKIVVAPKLEVLNEYQSREKVYFFETDEECIAILTHLIQN